MAGLVPRTVKRLLGLALGSVAALLLAELGLRALGVVREVGAPFSTWDAEDGVRLRPSLRATRHTPAFTMTLTTNRAGWRGPEFGTAPAGTVLFLGDSYTMGYGVDDGREFPALVARDLPAGVEVRNFGIGGTGNGRWLNVLDRELPRADARVVVMQFTGNDLADNLVEGLCRITDTGDLERCEPRPESRPRRMLRTVLEGVPLVADSHLMGMVRQLRFTRVQPPSRTGGNSSAGTPSLDLTMRIVEAALARCGDAGVPVLGLGVELEPEQERRLRDLFAARGATFLVSPTPTARPELFFATDPHWNEAGHRWAAGQVASALTSEPYAARMRSAR